MKERKPGQVTCRGVAFAYCSSAMIPIIGRVFDGDPVENGGKWWVTDLRLTLAFGGSVLKSRSGPYT